MSKTPCTLRVPPSLNALMKRISVWLELSSNWRCDGNTSTMTVAFGPAERVRRSDGPISALFATMFADCVAPGKCWKDALAWTSYGNVYTAAAFTCVCAPHGVTMSQKVGFLGCVNVATPAVAVVATTGTTCGLVVTTPQ